MANLDSKDLSHLEAKQKIVDRAPFVGLKIDDAKCLDTIEGREICGKCYKSRKFFCYTCCTPVIDRNYIPRVKSGPASSAFIFHRKELSDFAPMHIERKRPMVQEFDLPIKIDIIKHAREIDGKSTAIHAAVIAPEDVKIYTYPDFPEISKDDKVVLIFPSKTATRIDSLFVKEVENGDEMVVERIENEFPVTRAIFIDSTWHQTKAIYKDQRLRDLRCVVLKARISQFWRHQKSSPRWYLATIEAIHQFLVELHTNAFGVIEDYAATALNGEAGNPLDKLQNDKDGVNYLRQEYSGQYDNLLYFFKYMYEKIHTIYDHDKLWAYKRPLI